MIRGHVAFVDRDSPLPEFTPDSCKKSAIKLTMDNNEFYLKIKGRDFSFKVVRNIRAVDKHDIASGLVRIGFIIPNLDIVIYCNPGDLKTFIYTLEVVKDIVLPPRCSDKTHKWKLKCICQWPKFSQYQRYHLSCYDCPMSVHTFTVLGHDLCVLCCYRALVSYNDEDARKIFKTWHTCGKVARNIRAVDKHDIASGLVRIGFIIPNLDIVISCNPGDLKTFIYTLEVVKDIVLPPKCSDKTPKWKLKCICQGPKFSHYQRYHISCYDCPMSVRRFTVLGDDLCELCCYRVLVSYNDEDARKIFKSWHTCGNFTGYRTSVHTINVTSYTCMSTIYATNNNLTEIPEALGFLPYLRRLCLSDNRLGEAVNWNWLTSPFIRENLRQLDLDRNGLSNIPEPIVGLRKLEILSLDGNHLSELPDALRRLKYLRELYIEDNKLIILPAWVYRLDRLSSLYTENNEFSRDGKLSKIKPQLTPKDFAVAVPSLLQTVAKYIITERFAFWEYTIPATLTDYLEGAYYCRCGSVVFRDTISPVLKCRIETRALAYEYGDETAIILLRCCSYKCYELVKPYIRL